MLVFYSLICLVGVVARVSCELTGRPASLFAAAATLAAWQDSQVLAAVGRLLIGVVAGWDAPPHVRTAREDEAVIQQVCGAGKWPAAAPTTTHVRFLRPAAFSRRAPIGTRA
jgi:hypothetical protein